MHAGIGWRHPHYGGLLQQQPAIGFLEVHSENFYADGGAPLQVLLQGRANYPVSLHGVGLSLGSASGVEPWHLERLQRLVARIEPDRISDHACFARGVLTAQPDRSATEVHACDLLPVPFSDAALACMVANVQRVQERLQRSICVENLSAYVQWQGDTLSETSFLNALAQHSGCGLLIDLNNIYVNALNDQLQGKAGNPLEHCLAWIDAIAPNAVQELHLAGHQHCGDIVIDDHGSAVAEPVWQLYRHALARFGAVPTLIEWDTDLPPLDVLLDEAGRADQLAQECCP